MCYRYQCHYEGMLGNTGTPRSFWESLITTLGNSSNLATWCSCPLGASMLEVREFTASSGEWFVDWTKRTGDWAYLIAVIKNNGYLALPWDLNPRRQRFPIDWRSFDDIRLSGWRSSGGVLATTLHHHIGDNDCTQQSLKEECQECENKVMTD